jgi:hypothetical protein
MVSPRGESDKKMISGPAHDFTLNSITPSAEPEMEIFMMALEYQI